MHTVIRLTSEMESHDGIYTSISSGWAAIKTSTVAFPRALVGGRRSCSPSGMLHSTRTELASAEKLFELFRVCGHG